MSIGGQLVEKSLEAGGEAIAQVRSDSAMGAQWSPDGGWLAYAKYVNNQRELYLQHHSGQSASQSAGQSERLITPELAAFWLQPLPYDLIYRGFSWTPDSRQLVYVTQTEKREQLWQVEATGGTPRALSPLGSPTEQYLSPVSAAHGERVAFISRIASQAESKRRLLIAENHQVVSLYESKTFLQMIGWLGNDDELLVAEGKQTAMVTVQDATLLKCQVSAKRCLPVILLRDLYLSSLRLAPDHATVAYVAQRGRSLNIHLLKLSTGQIRPLTNNSDPGLFYAGLHWAYDSQRLFFSKQTSFEILRLIELR